MGKSPAREKDPCCECDLSVKTVLVATLIVSVLVLSCFMILNDSDGSDADPATSGTSGTGVNWELGPNGNLSITGSGDLKGACPYRDICAHM